MISRTHLRQFLAVVDDGNFTQAANRINVTQPSLSMGIAELERQLGTILFIREKRRIRLTEAGNHLLPYARNIERDFRLAESGVASLPVSARSIRLGVLHSFPTSLLEQAIARYNGADPLELVEGSERELLAALASGGVDLACTILHDKGARFADQLLFSEPYCLALPQDHRLAGASSLTVADVAGETMIARRSCELLSQTSRFFTERSARPRFSLRSANEDRAMAMVRAGLGITVAPQSLGGPGIAMVSLDGFAFRRNVGIAFGSDWRAHYGAAHALPSAFSCLT
jgi:DNA-binding transcriptional LysR family regulator